MQQPPGGTGGPGSYMQRVPYMYSQGGNTSGSNSNNNNNVNNVAAPASSSSSSSSSAATGAGVGAGAGAGASSAPSAPSSSSLSSSASLPLPLGAGAPSSASASLGTATTAVAGAASISSVVPSVSGAPLVPGPSNPSNASQALAASQQQAIAAVASMEKDKIFSLVMELSIPEQRENALLELSKKRDSFADLALVLWYSFGTMAALLQEIIAVYPLLSPPALSAVGSNRVCNALALLQCVASNPETKTLFLNAHIPLFLYPFLNTSSKARPFEYLRLTSLGVIGALVKTDEKEAIAFLLNTEIIPLCLKIMDQGSELSKTVATFIVQRILLDDSGLQYICQTYERFYHVTTVLNNMVENLVKEPSPRLIKHIVRCYLRLSENPRACEALKKGLPEPLKDNTFANTLKDDAATRRWLQQLLVTLSDTPAPVVPL